MSDQTRSEARTYYKLQYFDEYKKRWYETAAHPYRNPSDEEPSLELWLAFLQYMNLASNNAYRLVKVTTTIQEVTVNV